MKTSDNVKRANLVRRIQPPWLKVGPRSCTRSAAIKVVIGPTRKSEAREVSQQFLFERSGAPRAQTTNPVRERYFG
jgi:hypothetical protein